MKLSEIKPKLGQGQGIDLRKVRLTTKTMVAPAKLPQYDMKLLGLTLHQEPPPESMSKVKK